jgi:hypothetical protein
MLFFQIQQKPIKELECLKLENLFYFHVINFNIR